MWVGAYPKNRAVPAQVLATPLALVRSYVGEVRRWARLSPPFRYRRIRTVQEADEVSTGVVIVVVAVAVVLVVLIVALSIRGRQTRKEQQRRADRRDLREAEQRVGRAERDADIAREEADRKADPDR